DLLRHYSPGDTPKIRRSTAEILTKTDVTKKNKIFIGHGRSSCWEQLRDFLRDRLAVDWEEFNRISVAGVSTQERLQTMLENAAFAFLVFTAEEERKGGMLATRDNVIHELGLFQGSLGFKRAVILLEEGCSEFSNIV